MSTSHNWLDMRDYNDFVKDMGGGQCVDMLRYYPDRGLPWNQRDNSLEGVQDAVAWKLVGIYSEFRKTGPGDDA